MKMGNSTPHPHHPTQHPTPRPRPGPPSATSARTSSTLSYYTHPPRHRAESVRSGYASEGYSGPSMSPDGRDRWVPPPAPSVCSRTTTASRRSSLLSDCSGVAPGRRAGAGAGAASARSAASSRYTVGVAWPVSSINWVVDPTRRRA